MCSPVVSRRSLLKALAGGAACHAGAETSRPWNFVFVLIDDLGWHDTGPYGNTVVDTPNLNRFARESVRFTNAYAACPVCSPTRASILTGKYPARLQLTDWIPGRKAWPTARLRTPPFKQALPLEETTLAEALKSKGYGSASVGKWHLGGEGFGPLQQGFDRNVGGTAAGSPPTYFGPLNYRTWSWRRESFSPRVWLASLFALWMRMPHGRSSCITRASRYTFLSKLRKTLWRSIKPAPTGEIDPTYCAMIESTDQAIGALLKTVDEISFASRTVVVFFSDNGGVRFQESRRRPITDNAPLRAGKGHLFEGGIREPLTDSLAGSDQAGNSD